MMVHGSIVSRTADTICRQARRAGAVEQRGRYWQHRLGSYVIHRDTREVRLLANAPMDWMKEQTFPHRGSRDVNSAVEWDT